MDRYLLKNIIIIILVLVNGFLLGSLSMRYWSAAKAQDQMEEQLVALFASDGMELDPDIISQDAPPSSLSLSRDLDREQAAAAFFLGSDMAQGDQSGDTYTYSSKLGAASFRSNGGFDIVGTLSDADGEELCRRFCKDFSYSEPVFILDESGSGSATAVCLHGKLPVYNCTITFTFDQGKLLTVSGTLLPEDASVITEDRELLSAPAALTTFQQARRESYMVATAVTGLTPCYELQGSTASALSLTPVWRIATDTSDYYVNCITGTVTSD